MGNTDIFEMSADKYDTPERIEIAEIIADAISGVLINTEDKNAIDFGCGTGLVGMNLLKRFKSVLFLDSSHNMIQMTERKIKDKSIKNAETLCFDLEKGIMPKLHTDYIFMSQVLLHIGDVELFLSRMHGLLNTEGHLIIVDFDKNEKVVSDKVHNGFDQRKLADLMTNIGYGNIESRTFYSRSKMFMNQDASLFILNSQV